jgi:phosphonate transport system permease protein
MSEVETLTGNPWRKPPFIKRPWLRWTLILGFIAYLMAAYLTIDVNWYRVYEGLERGKKICASLR